MEAKTESDMDKGLSVFLPLPLLLLLLLSLIPHQPILHILPNGRKRCQGRVVSAGAAPSASALRNPLSERLRRRENASASRRRRSCLILAESCRCVCGGESRGQNSPGQALLSPCGSSSARRRVIPGERCMSFSGDKDKQERSSSVSL